MDRFAYDPFRLHHRPGPVPVEGHLPPPLRLVDEEDLVDPGRSIWLRGMAVLMMAMFALATFLTTAATTGALSQLTGSGNTAKPQRASIP